MQTAATAPPRLLLRPLTLTAWISVILLIALNLWRPFYHLTDDNLSGWLPQFTEFSQRLWSGKNPLTSEWLFGGNYDLGRDPGVLTLFGPYLLLCTPLGCSRWYYLAPDIIASLNLLTVALAFCWSGLRLRTLLNLRVTNGALVWLSLSYAFSPFNLIINPSWIGFINPQAAMPLILVALLEPSRRRAITLITAASLFAILGSHLHPFIFMNIFLGLLALILARQQRSWQPVWRLVAGVAIALLIISPLLLPASAGFTTSHRSAAVALTNATISRLPPLQLAASLVLGPVATPLLPEMRAFCSDASYGIAIAFSLINLPLLALLFRKRQWTPLERGLSALILVTMFLIMRPDWMQTALSHLPILRSLRWPFREVADLLFFLHILALLNFPALTDRAVRLWTITGTGSLATILFGPPPTFNPMHLDRELIISGKAAQYWETMRQRLGPNPRIIVAAHPQLILETGAHFAPFTLLGAYNYAAAFHIVNHSGYSPTQANNAANMIRPFHQGGIYWYPYAENIWRQNPEFTLIEYLRYNPSLLRVRHGTDTFHVIFNESTGDIRFTNDPAVVAALPLGPPLIDPKLLDFEKLGSSLE